MSELKQCSNCARWKAPLNRSACNLGSLTKETHDFKINIKGMFYCLDFKSKLDNKE